MKFSSQQFADFVGISKKSVQNYREQGMPSIKEKSYYKYNFEAIQWLYDNGIKTVAGANSQESEELTPRYRKDLAEAKLKEHALAVKEKKYILIDKVIDEQFKISRTIRDSLLSLKRIAPTLVKRNTHDIRKIIDREVFKILENLVNDKL